MFVRTTQIEIDTGTTPMSDALAVFETSVLPDLRQQPGFRGLYVATAPEGKALLVSFWETAEQADASTDAVWYWEVLGRFATLFRSPPSRERLEVAVAIAPELDVTLDLTTAEGAPSCTPPPTRPASRNSSRSDESRSSAPPTRRTTSAAPSTPR